MSSCLRLHHGGEYAIAVLARLASRRPDASPTPIHELARAQRLPHAFLTKILGRCARAGLLRSKGGPAGGVVLARAAKDISLLDVLEACEGSYRRMHCVFEPERACAGPDCAVYCPLRREEEAIRQRLSRVKLSDLAAALSAQGRKNPG